MTTTPTTFWQAARDIVQECAAILRPGGVAVWVTKDFVRKGARVRFSDDWARLCTACGFILIRRARAMLVEERVQAGLFGEDTVERRERKSFFRRLHESRLPPGDDRRIEHEDVLFMAKAGTDAGAVDAVVSSPPFTQGYAGGGGINVKGYGADGQDKVGSRTYQALGGDRTAGNLETMQLGDIDPVAQPAVVAAMVQVETWHGCYYDSWQGAIVPEAFAHPAKMSRALVRRIFDELEAMGVLVPGAVVVEPFGGIFTTGIEGAAHGVQVYGCELEPRFVALAQQNIDLHRAAWELCRCPIPVIVQGDSRKLRDHLAGVLPAAVVSSPPYAQGLANAAEYRDESKAKSDAARDIMACKAGKAADIRYGTTPGQLGALPPGTVDAVLSSPPYAEIATGAGGLNTKPARKPGQQSGRSAKSASQATDNKYGRTAGQLARLPIGDELEQEDKS